MHIIYIYDEGSAVPHVVWHGTGSLRVARGARALISQRR